MSSDPFALVSMYHHNLPDRIIAYLHKRGISDEVINDHRLGWNGQRITFPIFNRNGELAFFKLAKDPDDESDSPKMITSRGGSFDLYGWERVLAKPSRLIVCEGEFDRLVLESQGFAAVTSTGGAGSFRAEWTADLATIPEVYVCLDRDNAGKSGALRIGELVPHARVVELPEEVGSGGDVTDFLVRLGHSRDDFLELLERGKPVPAPPATLPVVEVRSAKADSAFARRIAELKQSVPIADIVSQYVTLQGSGQGLRGLCPFHDDHNPSLMVYGSAGTFRCYGCGRHGDVIDFLMMIEQLPFLRALDALDHFQAESHGQSPPQP